MEKGFRIFKVASLTQRPGMEDQREESRNILFQFLMFLQNNDLLVRRLVETIDDMIDEFALYSYDLSDEGMTVTKAAFYKWVGKTDNGMPPEDWRILEKALAKIRSEAGESVVRS